MKEQENMAKCYEYMNHAFDVGRIQFKELDDKAGRYLIVLSFFLGVGGYIGKWIFEQRLFCAGWIGFALGEIGIILILLIFAAWVLVFLVLRMTKVYELPVNDELIGLFKEGDLQGLAESYRKPLYANRQIAERKANLLWWGHLCIMLVGVFLFIFSVLFAFWAKGQYALNPANGHWVKTLLC